MPLENSSRIDLPAYFARIGYSGLAEPSIGTLQALHLAHATHIPFENLDVLLGRGVSLELEAIQRKLVGNRRGGYCFEQNALFSAVLEQLGFEVVRLLARVRLGTTRILPRTHMVLGVRVAGADWLADVGFGGWGLLEPIPLVAGRETRQGDWVLRLRREGAAWVLECPQCPVGPDQYVFTTEPQLAVDYEAPNHYCATHPQSRFRQTLTVQLPSPTARLLLRNGEFSTSDAQGIRTEILPDEAALLAVLEARFGLRLPPGTRFPSFR